ncbi:MAG: ABC transporter permease [Treponema sp.]|jgi:lipoprotein-releasing system permease protein|nr:ABC transporter permease [Treponema sp.]
MRWVGFVAARYVSKGRGSFASAGFSVLGIAVGVLALIVIISVMNGFQLGFIESILEISSGHVRVKNFTLDENGEGLIRQIRSLPQIRSALPFRELSVLVRGRYSGIRGALIRGVSHDALEIDSGFAEKLVIEEGAFDLNEPFNIVLGRELAKSLGVRTGGRISLLSVTGGLATQEEDGNFSYTVTGIFRCGYYEYDLGLAFINIDQAAALLSPGQKPELQIKLKNRWHDRQAIRILSNVLEGTIAEGALVSWREYNRAFFGALRTEKLLMFVLVGLIFIVVGLNIYQSQRRTVLERQEEVGLLKALGASDRAVQLIFVWDGLIMGGTGAGLGLALGLLISFNIPAFFTFLEKVVNLFLDLKNMILIFFGNGAGADGFSIFSPNIFYIKEIPSRVIPEEVVMIFLFGFLSAIAAAWIASMKVSRTKPAEVLRYE